jgi:hypothetical protein
MSSPRQSVLVMRHYRPAPENCARALELLLKKSVRKKGGPETAPEDARKDKNAGTYSDCT